MSRPRLLVSCRVDVHSEIGEDRDAVDQRLTRFLWQAGFSSVLVPNLSENALELTQTSGLVGLVLSGGNDLGSRPERDLTERELVQEMRRRNLGVFGICRGLQLLLSSEGISLEKVDGHVRTRHPIFDQQNNQIREVNSYHSLGALKVPPDWKKLATTRDGCVEWVTGPQRTQGIMWHPERETFFADEDLRLVHEHFQI